MSYGKSRKRNTARDSGNIRWNIPAASRVFYRKPWGVDPCPNLKLAEYQYKMKELLEKAVRWTLMSQPLFAVPVYFTALTGTPPYWLSLPLAILPAAIHVVRYRRPGLGTPFDIPVLLFILAMILGFVTAGDKGPGTGALATMLASVLIYYSITNNRKAGNRYWGTVGAIIGIIALGLTVWFYSEGTVRLVTFNSWVFKWFAWLPKTNGPVLQFNSVGTMLAVLVPGLVSMAIFKGARNLRLAAGALAVLFTTALALSDSGGGWIATAAGLVVVLYCRQQWTLAVTVPVLGMFAGFCAACYHRFSWIAPSFSTGSLMSRFTMWAETLQGFSGRQWFTGLGLGRWAMFYQERSGGQPVHVHNSYLQTYCDGGLIALAAMVIAAVQFGRMTIRTVKPSRDNPWYGVGVGLCGGIIAGAVMAMYDVTTTVTVWTSATGYIYMVIPFLWIWAGLWVVADEKLSAIK
jgi:O-antigen ligase